MAVVTPLIAPKDLRLLLNVTTYIAIFDDDNTNDIEAIDSSEQVQQCIEGAHAMMLGYLGPTFLSFPDGTDAQVSTLMQHAERLYAGYLAYLRRPEVALTNGDDKKELSLLKQAEKIMEGIRVNALRVAPNDAPATPDPGGPYAVSERRRGFGRP